MHFDDGRRHVDQTRRRFVSAADMLQGRVTDIREMLDGPPSIVVPRVSFRKNWLLLKDCQRQSLRRPAATFLPRSGQACLGLPPALAEAARAKSSVSQKSVFA